ncbi:DUF1501 domain-containing protein, partial [Pirellulales bacterium]|nr:DUF1501 domain-containing protein [Pirellulales bacterium]
NIQEDIGPMLTPFLRHTSVVTRRGTVCGRRDFLRYSLAGGAAAGTLNWTDWISASADELRSRGMACILLWMQGGPSQFETFSPLVGHDNGGEIKPISTNVPGIEISGNLPHCSKIADKLAVIRSMTSKEGNHQRATYLLHHGYIPMASVKHPTLGSNVAHQIGDAANQLPSYVRIGGRLQNAGAGGFLGVEYDPLVLRSAREKPANARPATSVDRFHRRLELLDSIQGGFASTQGAEVVADRQKLVARASDMILSPQMEAFDLAKEPAEVRAQYGEGEFAAGCQMARRLVERGVTFVEVASNGWDTHQDNFNRTARLTGQIDQPMAHLITDLHERGMLDKTLVVWMGEFGRTPRINPRDGRDHFPRAFNVALAGGGVRGGQVIGRVNNDGMEVADRPVLVDDLFRSIYHALGIDPDHENMSRIGRPIRLVEHGSVVEELFV